MNFVRVSSIAPIDSRINRLDAIRTHDLRLVKDKSVNLREFYRAKRDNFIAYLTDVRCISQQRVTDYMSTLTRKLPTIYDTKELRAHLPQEYTDPYGRALKNLFNFMEYHEEEEFNGIPIERWRRTIKLRRSGVREIYISDKELLIAYKNISERFRPLFKLLVYSGVRLTQALGGIEYLDNAITKGDVCRIPVNSISRGNKKVYWIYFPSSFLDELRGFDTHFNPYTYQKGIKFNRVSASTVRKWHLNFLIEQGIPESVCDFIQGRASVTVGSAHYLAKTQQADVWYVKVVPKLLPLFSSED